MGMLRNVRTGPRLIGWFLIVAALVVAASFVGYSNCQKLSATANDVFASHLKPIEQLGEAQAAMYRIRGEIYKYILIEEDRAATAQAITDAYETYEASIALYRANDLPADQRALVVELEANWARYAALIDEALTAVNAGDQASAIASIREGGDIATARAAVGADMEQLIDLNAMLAEDARDEANVTATAAGRAVIGIGLAGLVIALVLGFTISRTITAPLSGIVGVTNTLATGDLLRDMSDSDKEAIRGSNDEAGDVGKAITRVVLHMRDMSEAAARIAAGDLTVAVTPAGDRDELGNALSGMVVSLREAIAQVTDGAQNSASAAEQAAEASAQTGTATSQVAQTTEQVAKGANDAASAVVDANRGMEELSRAIDGIAQGAQEAAGAVSVMSSSASLVADEAVQVEEASEVTRNEAEQGKAVAAQGSQAVQDTINGMRELQRVVLEATTKVAEMGQRSQEVSRIVATIDDIAAQTNLLALNAQIEAARAGEQGRGFAVVADEVRKLAERSARATQEIAALVDTVQQGATDAIEAISRGDQEVETGVERAQRAGDVITELQRATERIAGQASKVSQTGATLVDASKRMMAEVERVSAVVEEVSASAEEMAASSTQVAESLGSVASIAQEVGASAQEVSASTEEVAAQSEEVSALVQTATEQSESVLAAVRFFSLDARAESPIRHAAPARPATIPAPARVAAHTDEVVVAVHGGNGYH